MEKSFKKILPVLLFCIFPWQKLTAQWYWTNENLVGVWQERDTILSAGWKSTYQFFPDGTFIYNTSQYDYTNRIRSIHGHYNLIGDELTVKAESRDEWVGGEVYFEDGAIYSDWIIDGVELKTFTQKSIVSSVEFRPSGKPGKYSYFQLPGPKKYWKISDDPGFYNK